jgi:hypothetical protein
MGPGSTRVARSALALAGVLAAAATALLGGAEAARPVPCPTGSLAAVACAGIVPVASLDPQGTDAEWAALVQSRRQSAPGLVRAAAEDCRPVRAVFYAASDWLRLATKLAAGGSPCAEYLISLPPLTADKTRPRPDQAWRIRALGPRFHALAEINFTAWSNWVAANGASWHDAGVEARRRMATAGYDVGSGDTWAVNEFSSAVRRGDGAARANARELVRGLFEADGALPQARGVAFTTGVSQRTPDLSTYKANLQGWLQDSAFWSDMSAYVSDFSQEMYADTRSYAVPGVPLASRRELLNDYLQHDLRLAASGPDTTAAARSYLQAAYSPVANAAWQWDTGFGWTMAALDQMQDFVSAQTYAMRFDGATARGGGVDRWGFAWAPRNALGLSAAEFTAQTGALIDRLAAAVHDSAATTVPGDPGVGSCGPAGQNLWCVRELAGASVSDLWRPFNVWAQPAVAFASAPQTLVAGATSVPMSVQLRIGGLASAAKDSVLVSLSSNSPAGMFAAAPEGPWTPTLTVTVPAGGTSAPPFYYRDTRAGAAVLTAVAAGYAAGTQTTTILAGAPISLAVTPAAVTLSPGGTRAFAAVGLDSFGNSAPATGVSWSVSPASLGTVSPAVGASTTFTAGGVAGSGLVAAAVQTPSGPLSSSAAITVLPPPRMRVTRIRYLTVGTMHRVTVSVADRAGRPVAGAAVSAALYRNGGWYASLRGATGGTGRVTFTRPARKTRAGCYTTRVRQVAATGYSWERGTPANRFCKRTPPRRHR